MTNTTKKPVKTEPVTLVSIADAAGVDFKVARAKFRRLYASDEKGLPKVQGEGWAFKPADVAAVKKLLKTDRRKAAE